MYFVDTPLHTKTIKEGSLPLTSRPTSNKLCNIKCVIATWHCLRQICFRHRSQKTKQNKTKKNKQTKQNKQTHKNKCKTKQKTNKQYKPCLLIHIQIPPDGLHRSPKPQHCCGCSRLEYFWGYCKTLPFCRDLILQIEHYCHFYRYLIFQIWKFYCYCQCIIWTFEGIWFRKFPSLAKLRN